MIMWIDDSFWTEWVVGGGVFEGKDKRYAERKEKKEKNTHNILV